MSVEFPLGNVYVRVNSLLKKGDRVPGHTHNFSHATIFIRGNTRVTIMAPVVDKDTGQPKLFPKTDAAGKFVMLIDPETALEVPVTEIQYVAEEVLDFGPGGFMEIAPHKLHAMEALTDDVEFFCVYAHRTPQGEIVPNFSGWRTAVV